MSHRNSFSLLPTRTRTHTYFLSPAGREERAPRRIVGRSCCRLHRVNEVPSGRGKTATLSSQSLCKRAYRACTRISAHGGGGIGLIANILPALIGIIRPPRVKGAPRARLSVSALALSRSLTCSRKTHVSAPRVVSVAINHAGLRRTIGSHLHGDRHQTDQLQSEQTVFTVSVHFHRGQSTTQTPSLFLY